MQYSDQSLWSLSRKEPGKMRDTLAGLEGHHTCESCNAYYNSFLNNTEESGSKKDPSHISRTLNKLLLE